MKLYYLLTSLSLAISSLLYGQCDREINGQILDADTHEPLAFATIKISNSSLGTVSDINGFFHLTDICEEEVHLEVQFVGYKKLIHHHDFHHADPIIYLAADETLLESVVVEENRIEKLQTMALQRSDINQLEIASHSIGQLTEELSGVTLLKTGANISKPIIHGLHSNRILVINDGVRHAYQVWGQEHAPEIDPSHVDQIKLVKGAATVKYGPEALGGVLLYNSGTPTFDQHLNGNVVASYQTNGKAPSSSIRIGHGTHRFAWDLAGYGIYLGDQHAPKYNLTNTGKREYGTSFNTVFHQAKFDIKISGSYFEQELGILRGSIGSSPSDLQNAINRGTPNPTRDFTYTIQNPRQVTNHGLLKSELLLFLGEHSFNFQYAYQQNKREEYDVRRGELNERPVINLDLISHSVETEWTQPSTEQWSGSSGIQVYTQNSTNFPGTNPLNFVPDYDVINMGAYTIQSVELNETILEFGARLDFQTLSVADTIRDVFTYTNEINFSNPTFTIGARKKLNNEITVFSNLGTAWRAPNVAELYAFGYHSSRLQFGFWRYDLEPTITTPVDSVFDQSLREVPPEQGYKWVSGIELRKKNLSAEFIFYANKIQNYIFMRPYGVSTSVIGTFAYFILDQTDAVFFGSDCDIRYNHPYHLMSELKLSYVYAKSTDRNQALLEIPPLNIDYSLEYKDDGIGAGLNLNYSARQWNAPSSIEPEDIENGDITIDLNNDIFDFMDAPKGFLLVGGHISYEKKSIEAQLRVDNLFNQSYRLYTDRQRYYSDALGRNFSISLNYKF